MRIVLANRSARLIVAAIAAALAVGIALLVLLGRSEPPPVSETSGGDFWSALNDATPVASDIFVPDSLETLAEPAELIVVGAVQSVDDGGKLTGLDGRPGLEDEAVLDVQVEKVVGGEPQGDSNVVRLSMIKLETVPYSVLRDGLPSGRALFFLVDLHADVVRIATRDGWPVERTQRWAGKYGLMGTWAIVVEADGGLAMPLAPGLAVALLPKLGGARTIDELVALVEADRERCDTRKACLRDVFNPAGPTRSGLTDEYPPLAKPE